MTHDTTGRYWRFNPCGECDDPDCCEGDSVDATAEVAALRAELARMVCERDEERELASLAIERAERAEVERDEWERKAHEIRRHYDQSYSKAKQLTAERDEWEKLTNAAVERERRWRAALNEQADPIMKRTIDAFRAVSSEQTNGTSKLDPNSALRCKTCGLSFLTCDCTNEWPNGPWPDEGCDQACACHGQHTAPESCQCCTPSDRIGIQDAENDTPRSVTRRQAIMGEAPSATQDRNADSDRSKGHNDA